MHAYRQINLKHVNKKICFTDKFNTRKQKVCLNVRASIYISNDIVLLQLVKLRNWFEQQTVPAVTIFWGTVILGYLL